MLTYASVTTTFFIVLTRCKIDCKPVDKVKFDHIFLRRLPLIKSKAIVIDVLSI